MGVNKLLRQGLDNERKNIDLEKQKTEEEKKKKAAEKKAKAKADKEAAEKAAKEEAVLLAAKESTNEAEEAKEESKHPGGRPTLESLGKTPRKQYTLTLKETDYKAFLERAGAEDMSFAKFMEKAAKEYISNHKTE